MKFEVGDEVWYMGRGRDQWEGRDRIDGTILRFRNSGTWETGPPGAVLRTNGDHPLGEPFVPLSILNHANALIEMARAL